MNTKVLLLGAGLVGRPMALDLIKDESLIVAIADINKDQLNNVDNGQIHKIQADLSDKDELKALVNDYDIILNAVPGSIGFQTLKF